MTRRKISRTLSARRTLKPPFNTGSGDKKLSNLQQNYRPENTNTKDESKEPLGYGRFKAGLEFEHLNITLIGIYFASVLSISPLIP